MGRGTVWSDLFGIAVSWAWDWEEALELGWLAAAWNGIENRNCCFVSQGVCQVRCSRCHHDDNEGALGWVCTPEPTYLW